MDQNNAVVPGVVVSKPLSAKAIAAASKVADVIEAQRKNFGDVGHKMAREFLAAVGTATVSWQLGIIGLLKTANNVQRELAMKGCIEEAAANSDEGAVVSLKKRVSESRRVFKAADADYKGTLAIMEGKGSWSVKISKLPKATKAGRPQGSASTATTGTTAQAGQVPGSDQGDALKANTLADDLAKGIKVKSVPTETAVAAIRMQSPKGLLACLDVVAYALSALKGDSFKGEVELGKAIMALRDKQDGAAVRASAIAAAA